MGSALRVLEINQDAYSLKQYAGRGGVGFGDIFVFTSTKSVEPILGIDTCNEDGEQHRLITLFFALPSREKRQIVVKHLRDFFDSTYYGYRLEEGQDINNYMFRSDDYPKELDPGVWQKQILVE